MVRQAYPDFPAPEYSAISMAEVLLEQLRHSELKMPVYWESWAREVGFVDNYSLHLELVRSHLYRTALRDMALSLAGDAGQETDQ